MKFITKMLKKYGSSYVLVLNKEDRIILGIEKEGDLVGLIPYSQIEKLDVKKESDEPDDLDTYD